MTLSPCPVCNVDIPLTELEWHANSHFVEDELGIIAMAPPSPTAFDGLSSDMESTTAYLERAPDTCGSGSNDTSAKFGEILDQKIYFLIGLQTKNILYKVEGGIMNLLRNCLEKERGNLRSIISGYVDHYQSNQSEDFGWGCGWRNIQMLSSHLLMQRVDARNVMFGGSGFVPDIPSLQRWLEIAWERGFDSFGADSFDHKIYGSRRWIGTTECATLFRSFGLRARIVDFDSIGCSDKLNSGLPRGKMKEKKIYGPMDKYLLHAKHDGSHAGPSSKNNFLTENHGKDDISKSGMMNHDSCKTYEGDDSGHQVLLEWVWNYFTSEFSNRSNSSKSVLISEKTPLYLQHDGHSRTIIGIQMQKKAEKREDCYCLLILDPNHKTAALEKSLRENNGWQKLIKRGVHTLKKPQYQLCYIDPGIAYGDEIEQLKIIDSILVKL